MTTPRGLPVRNIADVHVADALARPGCPVCGLRARAESGYIRALLWENVNDPRTRIELERAGGYCARHTHAVLAASREQSGPAVGAAILFQALLSRRLEALQAARSSGRRRQGAALRAVGQPARCPVCRVGEEGAARAIDAMLAQLGDAEWVTALERADFCLADLSSMWTRVGAAVEPAWLRVADAQIQRIETIRALLERFAHHNTDDRRHLLTPAERASVGQAETLLAGDADRPVSSKAG